ncbi:MAG: NUDIX domain-containing protein [Thaumarchaeota archaeon]|nr:NUDIX domain-containing protein [Nitrososphaerota archaeon]
MEERSAGALIYRETSPSRVYLLLEYPAGHWDFPKGNIEEGEGPQETMVREVSEETGLKSIRVVDGFRNVIEYYYNRNGKRVHKQVIFFLAEATDPDESVKLSFEHRQFAWKPFDEALGIVSYQNSRRLLRAAEQELGHGGGIDRLKS